MQTILSTYVRDHFRDAACSFDQVERFVKENARQVADSYPAYDWNEPLPTQGVFRIQELRPAALFQKMSDTDPEYSLARFGDAMLLIVGNSGATALPLELNVVEGSALRLYGHTHPGSADFIRFPGLEDFINLVSAGNKTEFIFNKGELVLYHQPAPEFVAQLQEQNLAPRKLVNKLYEHYITKTLGLDEPAFSKDPMKYYGQFCQAVFGAQVIAKEDGAEVQKALSALLNIGVSSPAGPGVKPVMPAPATP